MAYSQQETFDIVVRALVAQGEPSVLPYTELGQVVNCRYRGPNGLKCAVGHLIPDDVYDPHMEGGVATNLAYVLQAQGHDFLLACALQVAHDAAANIASDWLDGFVSRAREVARRFRLSSAALDDALAQRAAKEVQA